MRSMTPNDARALAPLDQKIGRTMRPLAEDWECDASNATWVVDRLERLGLAERRAVTGDRRIRHVVLTAKGRKTRADLMREYHAPPADLLELDRDTLRPSTMLWHSCRLGARAGARFEQPPLARFRIASFTKKVHEGVDPLGHLRDHCRHCSAIVERFVRDGGLFAVAAKPAHRDDTVFSINSLRSRSPRTDAHEFFRVIWRVVATAAFGVDAWPRAHSPARSLKRAPSSTASAAPNRSPAEKTPAGPSFVAK